MKCLPTQLIFGTVKSITSVFTVPKINCVGCAWASLHLKSHLKNVINIWKPTVYERPVTADTLARIVPQIRIRQRSVLQLTRFAAIVGYKIHIAKIEDVQAQPGLH